MNGLAGRRGFFAVAAYTMAYRPAPALAIGEVKRQAGIKLNMMLVTTFRDIRRSRRASTSAILKRNAYVMGVTLSGTGVRNDFTLSEPAALKEPTDRRGRVSSLKEELMRFTHLSNGLLLLAWRRFPFLGGDQTSCQCERKVRYD